MNIIQVLEGFSTGQINKIIKKSSETISDSSLNGSHFELHDILRQGARLIAENVLDLSELLVQRRRSCHRWRILCRVVHLSIPIDEEGLPEANDLDGDVKRDGDQSVQDDYVGPKIRQPEFAQGGKMKSRTAST